MKVKFLVLCEIEVYETVEEAAEGDMLEEGQTEVFLPGQEADFDIVDHPLRFNGTDLVEDPNILNVQFGDGSVAFGISREWFEEVDEEVE